MTEVITTPTPKISVTPLETYPPVESGLLTRAASDMAGAVQLGYFREYPVGFTKPSDSEISTLLMQAKERNPQFAEKIQHFADSYSNSRHAREIAGSSVGHLFSSMANPITREFWLNRLMVRLRAHNDPFRAREIAIQRGNEEAKVMIESLGLEVDRLRLLTPVQASEAYLQGTI